MSRAKSTIQYNSKVSSSQAIKKQNKKQKVQKLGVSLPLISASSQRLQIKINQFKNNHAQLTKKLEQSILNNNLYKAISLGSFQNIEHSQFLDKKHYTKHRSISLLSNNIQKRIQNDVEAERLLQKMQKQVNLKKSATQKRLKQIQQRNLLKINQIQQFQKNFINKVKEQMMKNVEKEKRLKKQFEKLKKQNNKIAKAKQTQSKLDQQGWKSLIDKKINLEKLMKNHIKQQNKLIQQKNPQVAKKQHQIKVLKQQKKARQRVKLDAKQAGRQYLDFAKKSGSKTTKSGKKKLNVNYLNVNLKVINYDNQILEKIVQSNTARQWQNEKSQNVKQQSTKLVQNIKLPQQKETQSSQNNLPNKIVPQKYDDILPILQENNSQQNQKQSSKMKQTFFMNEKINETKGNIEQISCQQCKAQINRSKQVY